MPKLINRQLLYTFLVGLCVGATALMAVLFFSGKAPWLTAAGVGTGAPDVNARYLDGYPANNVVSANSIYVSKATSGYLPSSTVDTNAIVDGTITTTDISSSAAITSAQIADGSGSGLDTDLWHGINVSITNSYTYCKTSSTYTGAWYASTPCTSQCGTGYIPATLTTGASTPGIQYNFSTSLGTIPSITRYQSESTCDDGIAWWSSGVTTTCCYNTTTEGCWQSSSASTNGDITSTSSCAPSTIQTCNKTALVLCVKSPY